MKKLYIQTVKKCLAELADEKFQRKVWLSDGEPEVSSFSELRTQLFDDSGLSDLIDESSADKYLGAKIVSKIRKLDRLMSGIDEFIEPSVLIDQPIMEQVRSLADEILNDIEASDGRHEVE